MIVVKAPLNLPLLLHPVWIRGEHSSFRVKVWLPFPHVSMTVVQVGRLVRPFQRFHVGKQPQPPARKALSGLWKRGGVEVCTVFG
jgi:hypothetical protein